MAAFTRTAVLLWCLAASTTEVQHKVSGVVQQTDKSRPDVAILVSSKTLPSSTWFAITQTSRVFQDGGPIRFTSGKIRVADVVAVTYRDEDIPEARWSCDMHPKVVSKTAGKCPICSMSLKRTRTPIPLIELTIERPR